VVEKPEVKWSLLDLGVDGRIKLQFILNIQNIWMWFEFSLLTRV
jgi:hypothetical protein